MTFLKTRVVQYTNWGGVEPFQTKIEWKYTTGGLYTIDTHNGGETCITSAKSELVITLI